MAEIGNIIGGKYRLTSVLGVGGMGVVYLAEHTLLGKRVAIKVLGSAHAEQPNEVERFYREAQAAAAVGHKGIVEIHDVGWTDDQLPYIVMENLQGENLAQVIQRRGPLPPKQVVDIGVQVLSALIAVHRRNIIHRDLKPENIFISYQPDGQDLVKILDFGISKITADSLVGPALTRSGTFLGTPFYMSPEQARGSTQIDSRVDLWAMGAILYEALTGNRAFEGRNIRETLYKIVIDDVFPPTKLRPEVPPSLEAVVLRSLAKDPSQRFPRALEFLEALLEVRNELGADEPRGSSPESPIPLGLEDIVIEADPGDVWDLQAEEPPAPQLSDAVDEDADTLQFQSDHLMAVVARHRGQPAPAHTRRLTHEIPNTQPVPKGEASSDPRPSADDSGWHVGLDTDPPTVRTAKGPSPAAVDPPTLRTTKDPSPAAVDPPTLRKAKGPSPAAVDPPPGAKQSADTLTAGVNTISMSLREQLLSPVVLVAAAIVFLLAVVLGTLIIVAVRSATGDEPEVRRPAAPAQASTASPLTQQEIVGRLSRLTPRVGQCLASSPARPRVLTVTFRIAGDGSTEYQSAEPPQPPAVETCLRQLLASTTFRNTGFGTVNYSYPFPIE